MQFNFVSSIKYLCAGRWLLCHTALQENTCLLRIRMMCTEPVTLHGMNSMLKLPVWCSSDERPSKFEVSHTRTMDLFCSWRDPTRTHDQTPMYTNKSWRIWYSTRDDNKTLSSSRRAILLVFICVEKPDFRSIQSSRRTTHPGLAGEWNENNSILTLAPSCVTPFPLPGRYSFIAADSKTSSRLSFPFRRDENTKFHAFPHIASIRH